MKRRKHTVKPVRRSQRTRKVAVKDQPPVRESMKDTGRRKESVLHGIASALDAPVLRLHDDAPDLVRDLASSPVPGARLLGAMLGAVTGDVRGGRALAGEGLQEGDAPQEGAAPSRLPQDGPQEGAPAQEGARRIVLREDGMAEFASSWHR